VFEAGSCIVVCSQPLGTGGRADRFLRKHPDGVGTLVFEVEDAERAFKLLEERGGTLINDIQTWQDDGGTLRTFRSRRLSRHDISFHGAPRLSLGRPRNRPV